MSVPLAECLWRQVGGAGRRHSASDLNGSMLEGTVHGPDIQDRDGAPDLIEHTCKNYPTVNKLFANGGYRRKPRLYLKGTAQRGVNKVQRPPDVIPAIALASGSSDCRWRIASATENTSFVSSSKFEGSLVQTTTSISLDCAHTMMAEGTSGLHVRLPSANQEPMRFITVPSRQQRSANHVARNIGHVRMPYLRADTRLVKNFYLNQVSLTPVATQIATSLRLR